MKKIYKIWLLTLILIITIIVGILFIYDFFFKEKLLSENYLFKELLVNYDKMEIINISDEVVANIDTETSNKILELLKEAKIVPVKFYEYDYINNSSSYMFLLTKNNYNIQLNVSDNIIFFNSKSYHTDKNYRKILSDVLKQYSNYLIN